MARLEAFPDLGDAQFVEAPDVARIAARVLDEKGEPGQWDRLFDVRRAVREGDIVVGYLSNTKPFDPMKDDATHDAIAKAIKAPTLWHDLTGFDAIIWVRSWWWTMLEPKAREALVAHELLHLDVRYDEQGEVVLAIRKHDLEEFGQVIGAYGAVLPGTSDFLRVAGLGLEASDAAGSSDDAGRAALDELNRDLDGDAE